MQRTIKQLIKHLSRVIRSHKLLTPNTFLSIDQSYNGKVLHAALMDIIKDPTIQICQHPKAIQLNSECIEQISARFIQSMITNTPIEDKGIAPFSHVFYQEIVVLGQYYNIQHPPPLTIDSQILTLLNNDPQRMHAVVHMAQALKTAEYSQNS